MVPDDWVRLDTPEAIDMYQREHYMFVYTTALELTSSSTLAHAIAMEVFANIAKRFANKAIACNNNMYLAAQVHLLYARQRRSTVETNPQSFQNGVPAVQKTSASPQPTTHNSQTDNPDDAASPALTGYGKTEAGHTLLQKSDTQQNTADATMANAGAVSADTEKPLMAATQAVQTVDTSSTSIYHAPVGTRSPSAVPAVTAALSALELLTALNDTIKNMAIAETTHKQEPFAPMAETPVAKGSFINATSQTSTEETASLASESEPFQMGSPKHTRIMKRMSTPVTMPDDAASAISALATPVPTAAVPPDWAASNTVDSPFDGTASTATAATVASAPLTIDESIHSTDVTAVTKAITANEASAEPSNATLYEAVFNPDITEFWTPNGHIINKPLPEKELPDIATEAEEKEDKHSVFVGILNVLLTLGSIGAAGYMLYQFNLLPTLF